MRDTIVAPATSLGHSAIGIVRLSGPSSLDFILHIFRPVQNADHRFSPEPYRMYPGFLYIPCTQDQFDQVMLCYMKAPHSYTGEDTVEVYCHGNPVIIQLTIKYLMQSGARMAEPGEFTRRAFLNGKIDLLQAESVNNLIRSRTVESEKAAYRILQGRLSGEVNALKKHILQMLSRLHASIDFSTETEETPRIEFIRLCSTIQAGILRLLSSYEYGSRLQAGLNVVIIGAPNVGKSSLFNSLLVEDRALVTSVPGTTRDALREIINVRGIPIILIDTAGLRRTTNRVEKMGIDLTYKALDEADLILFLLDGGRKISARDKEIWKKIKDQRVLVIINKEDLLNEERSKYYKKMFPESITVSASKGEGLERVNENIYNLAVTVKPQSGDIAIISLRHKIALEEAQRALQEFMNGLQQKVSEELLLVDLQQALDELKMITGEIVTDDILDVIFNEFCLGK